MDPSTDQGAAERVEVPDQNDDSDSQQSHGDDGQHQVSSSADGEPRQTRKERRQSEFQQAREEARAARELAENERRERERLSAQLAELNGRIQERDRQAERDAKDPYADRISALEDEAQAHLERVANSKDPAVQKSEMRLYNAKMREAAKLDLRRDYDRAQQDNPRRESQGMSPRDEAMWVALEADFPMISERNRAGQQFRSVADLHLNRLFSEGKPDNLATLRAACAMAAKELKIGGQDSRSSNGQRAAFSGYSNGDGAGGRGSERPTVEYGKHEAALAQALANRAGKGATGEEAKKLWLEKVGQNVARRLSEE